MNTSKPTQISIKMEQYGDRGWQWTQTNTNYIDERVTTTYRTNREGGGLWAVGSYEGKWAHNYEDKQIRGTCQFSLSSNRRTAYGQIRHWIVREHSITI